MPSRWSGRWRQGSEEGSQNGGGCRGRKGAFDGATVEPDLETLAAKTHLPVSFLENIRVLLEDKKQVIFQGPPGTGKTFVAQELAETLAGSKDRVTLVQFHPDYAYEQFIQGYRPRSLPSGQITWEVQKGTLLRAAERARNEPGSAHYLVIDEINRGNLAKVFGELYFLLEYRDREMQLHYSEEPFSPAGQPLHNRKR